MKERGVNDLRERDEIAGERIGKRLEP